MRVIVLVVVDVAVVVSVLVFVDIVVVVVVVVDDLASREQSVSQVVCVVGNAGSSLAMLHGVTPRTEWGIGGGPGSSP